MQSVIQILETLESDNSRLFKEEILGIHHKNELLKRIFRAAGDPYVNFYVNKFKMPLHRNEDAVETENAVVENFLNVIYARLATRDVTGNDAKSLVNQLFENMSAREQKWCLRILLRNLRVGVSSSTVEKVWPGLVQSFSVQLAETLKTHVERDRGIIIDDVVSYPVRVEPKLDGLRCVAVKSSGNVTIFTRNGSTLDTLPTVRAALENATYDDCVLDGEILGENWNESASVVMSHKKNKDDSNLVFHVFDAVPLVDWREQSSTMKFNERNSLALSIVNLVRDSHVKIVEGITAFDERELMEFYSHVMDKGYEGIMVKDISSPYIFKRAKNVLKMKPVVTYEGIIVGHYEGRRGSKREGQWGGFEVALPNKIITRVGSGFTDVVKAEINLDPDSWIGKIVEVEGQPDPVTKDGLTRDGRIRFPVYVRTRDPRDVDMKQFE